MYKLQSDGSVIREADGAIIPQDYGNYDYRAYLAWVADGNSPTTVVVRPLDPTDTTYGDNPWLF